MPQVTASCLCGDIRVTASGEPYRVGLCHCFDCRKHHGALFFAAAMFPEDAVTISGDTNHFKGRHFCPRCGSSMFNRVDDEVELHLGALDEQPHGRHAGGVGQRLLDRFEPTYECWAIRREAWLPPFPLRFRYDRNRDAGGRRDG